MSGEAGIVAIRNGRIVDPVAGTMTEGGLILRDGRIAEVGAVDHATIRASDIVADARGALVAPGIVDIGVFAIDPPACAIGGITAVALMPDQSPALDDAAMIQRAAAGGGDGLAVHPIAAATTGLDGMQLAEIGLMRAAGARAIATGRARIADAGVMHRLLAYAAALDLPVILHAEDEGLAKGSVATSGETATRLGLSAAPAVAEAMAVARDVMLAEETGARIHFRQLTTGASFDLVRAAKKRGIKVTCGVTPAHLLLSDIAVTGFRTFARLSPPLRSEDDRKAAIAAVADGTVDVLCSGHDPRGPEEKRLPFADAAPGMAGAETLLTLSLILVRDGVVDLPGLFRLLSTNPAKLLGIDVGRIAVGAPADLLIVDPDVAWRIDAARMVARAGNTPFDGLPVQGRVLRTIRAGRPLG